MAISRRRVLHQVAGASASTILSSTVRAQTYPARPVRIVVGFAPGGGYDIYARLMGQWLSERLGQSFIVENRPGGGGNVAAESVARAAPDGYTLLLAGFTEALSAALYENLKFNFMRDVAPIASFARGIGILVVHPSFPSNSVAELIAYARSNPGKITAASAGIGSIPHMFLELFKNAAGIDIVHVPYRGGGPALTDLLGGQVQVYFGGTATMEYVRTGKLRALATTGATRAAVLPDVPALAEFLPGYEASYYFGIVAPRNTSADIIMKLNREINLGIGDPRIAARIAEFGDTALALSPAAFGKLIADETEKWAKLIRAANIRAE
jgi:tripartite-type tricarboxylate transporter receptor subunit TctC